MGLQGLFKAQVPPSVTTGMISTRQDKPIMQIDATNIGHTRYGNMIMSVTAWANVEE